MQSRGWKIAGRFETCPYGRIGKRLTTLVFWVFRLKDASERSESNPGRSLGDGSALRNCHSSEFCFTQLPSNRTIWQSAPLFSRSSFHFFAT